VFDDFEKYKDQRTSMNATASGKQLKKVDPEEIFYQLYSNSSASSLNFRNHPQF